MRRSRSPHVSHVTRADDEGNGPPEFMCHMWMRERPPPMRLDMRSMRNDLRKTAHIAIQPDMVKNEVF